MEYSNSATRLRRLGAALTMGAVMTLGALTFVAHTRGPIAPEFSAIALAAVFLALIVPAGVMALRAVLTLDPRKSSSPTALRRWFTQRLIVLAVLDGVVVFCSVAVVMTGFLWVAAVALVPIVAMALCIPRGEL